jgi:hypothetical protein
MTVGEVSDRMTALEETYWYARCKDKPFTDSRIEIALAQIAQLIHNSNVSKKQQTKPLLAFLPFYKKQIEVQDDVTQDVRSFFGVKKDK